MREDGGVFLCLSNPVLKAAASCVGMLLMLLTAIPSCLGAEPIRLHPDNPHYFLFRGRPTVLITSGEHYGAVLNLDFDYVRYLDELRSKNLNLTRTFSGSYRELPGSFAIPDNTLGPARGRFICPWARSTTPGAADGGNKFDLTQWDEAYFRRLKDFLSEASRRGIVVEFSLFCVLYNDDLWNFSPMNARNNVNGIGDMPKEEVLTLHDSALTRVQEAMVRKIVEEINGFDNFYYELVNEPYFLPVSQDFHDRMAGVIVESEASLPNKHLIAQNYNNGFEKVCNPSPSVKVHNFHYANPPITVAMNYGLNQPISFDEDGFRGAGNRAYRVNAWEFLLAGGAVYDGLDYSFTASHPDGTFPVPEDSPGGGSSALRKQLQILRQFIESFDFIHMNPDNSIIKGGVARGDRLTYTWKYRDCSWWDLVEDPPDTRAWALVNRGQAWAVYIKGGNQCAPELDLPAGSYKAEWINTKTGGMEKEEEVRHPGGTAKLTSPPYRADIALRVRRE
jgi:hypothetical protein